LSDINLTARETAVFCAAADVLIPATAQRPCPSSLPGYLDMIRRAVRACGHPADEIRAALRDLASFPALDLSVLRDYAATRPARFSIAAQLASAAYYMDPTVLAALGYPTERRDPAALDEFAAEFETGILDPIMQAPPRYRDTERGRR
jgi:hypothetical protein